MKKQIILAIKISCDPAQILSGFNCVQSRQKRIMRGKRNGLVFKNG